jgi:hypothetical protein
VGGSGGGGGGRWRAATADYVCSVFSSPHLRSIVFSCHIFSRRKGISFSFEASRATHVRSACTSLFNL